MRACLPIRKVYVSSLRNLFDLVNCAEQGYSYIHELRLKHGSRNRSSFGLGTRFVSVMKVGKSSKYGNANVLLRFII